MKKSFLHFLKPTLMAVLFLIGLNGWGQTTVNYAMSSMGLSDATVVGTSVRNTTDGNITFTFAQNSSGTAPTYYTSGTAVRLYQNATKGGSIKIMVASGYKITSATVTKASGSGDGPVGYAVDNTIEAGSFADGTTSNTTGAINATDFVEFYSKGTSSTTRFYLVSFSVTYEAAASPPTITTPNPTSLSGFTTTTGTASSSQTFTVGGSNLTANLVVTAPTDYEVRENGTGSFGSSVSFTPASGTVASKTIEVRIAASAGVGSPSGNVVCSSTGATSQNVAVSGTVSAASCTPQTITFGALASKTYGDANFSLTATASSGLSVSYSSSNTAVATVSGSTVTIVGAGSTTITASQSGNATYCAATSVDQSLTVNPKALTITGAAASNKAYDGTNSATITGSLSGIVGADVVTLNGTGTFASVNVANGISVTSTSTLGGADAGNYTLTQPIGLTADITKADQTITLAATDSKNEGAADYTLGATSPTSVTNPLSFSSSNTSVATIDASTGLVHIVAAGTTIFTVSQGGSSNYNAASDATQTLTVSTAPCGSETFTNSNATTSYADNSFIGDNSVTWTYVASRDENGDANGSGISGKALMLRRVADGSKVTSSSVAGGIGDFSVTLYKGFTGSGNRQVELFVNGVSKGSSTAFDDYLPHTFSVTGINVSGNIVVELRNITAYQIIVDDITWTCYSGPSTPTITISTSSLSGFSYLEGSGPSTEQSFDIEGSDLTADISVAPPTNYEISTGTGGSFVATNPITLTQVGGTVSSTAIYVRLKSGLSGGAYNSEDITASSTGATAQTVSCNGDVTPILTLPMSEDFSSASMPTGWTNTDFAIGATSNAGGSANEVGLSFSVDQPNVSHITTAPINTTGSTNLVLQWNQKVDFYESGSGSDFVVKVQTSTNGSVFTDIWSQTVTADETALKQTTISALNGAGSGTLYIRWLYFSNTTNRFSYWYIDDVNLESSTSPNDPATFNAAVNSTTQIDLTASANGNGDEIVVAYNSTSSFGTPSDGNSYSVSDAIPGGGTVMFTGPAGSLSAHTGLTPGTTYYYKVWSVDGSNLYSVGLTDDATTLLPEPSNHVSDFLVATASTTHNSITITWSDNDGTYAADNYLIKASATSYAAITDPVDGTPEADAALVQNIASGVESVQFTGLSASTTYYFKIWPYSNTGGDINYKTGSEPQATETTDATPPLPNAWINEIHYDNDGTDANEIIEIVVEGVSNYTLGLFKVYLVNGGNGTIYNTKTLGDYIAGDVVNDHSIYYYNYTSDGGIQNGSPDGIALEYDGTLIMFLSYEGSFTGVGGIVDGVASTDIGVSEASTAAVGTSLQLLPKAKSGSKSEYDDFEWTSGEAATAGNSNSDGGDGNGDQSLPVNLLSFTAEAGDGFVAMNWSTSSEVNNSHFTIERSYDNLNYVEAGMVAAAGNSNQLKEYSFIDPIEVVGLVYYRLRQTDFDGEMTLSKPIEVSKNAIGFGLNGISIENQTLTLNISSGSNQAALVEVYTLDGRLIFNQAISLSKGSGSYNIGSYHFSGIVIMNIISNEGIITKKIFVQ